MSPAELAARQYVGAEERFRERARFYRLTGHQVLSEGAEWYAHVAHRAARAEIKDPVPVALRRVR